MRAVFFDASALAKRYSGEPGAPLVNIAFVHTPRPQMHCAIIGALEIISILTRRLNDGRLTNTLFQNAIVEFDAEILDNAEFVISSISDELVRSAISYLTRYNLNATDAMVLRTALDLRESLTTDDQLSFWASDKRLLHAANAEGLTVFDPEQNTITRLHEILGVNQA